MLTEAHRIINIFYVHARVDEDEALRVQLDQHFTNLRRLGQIQNFHGQEVSPGLERMREIERFLTAADIILLLVSPDFIASDYCSYVVQRAMLRHTAGEARVIPILLRPVEYEDTPFSELQSLPRNTQAITSWKNRDEAFVVVAKEIREVIQKLLTQNSSSGETVTDATRFTMLSNQVINILTSFSDENQAGGVSTTRFGEDAYEQGKRMYEAVRKRFDQEADGGLASGVLKNFIGETEKYRDDFQKRLISLLQADPDFAKKLRSVIARSLCIGRDHELQEYADFLVNDSPWIWTLTGLEGSGKTYLLNQMKEKTPSDIVVIRLDFASEQNNYAPSTGKREPMNDLKYFSLFVGQLKKGCDPQTYADFEKKLEKALEEENKNISEFIAQITQIPFIVPNAKRAGNILYRILFIVQHLKDAQKTLQRNRRTQMTDAFGRLMDSFKLNQHLVILLDTCEWLMESINGEAREWLLQDIFLSLHEKIHQRQGQCHIVMMSTVALPLRLQGNNDRKDSSLELLEKEPVEEYLKRIGVDNQELRVRFYDMTYGYAECVDILRQLWLQWDKEGKQISGVKTPIQFQKDFNEKAEKDFIEKHMLAKLPKLPASPLYNWARFGVLLPKFNQRLLEEVFSDPPLSFSAPQVKMWFDQFTKLSYVISLESGYYAILELLRRILGYYIREREPETWERYHQLAINLLLKDRKRLMEIFDSPDWHYHNLALELALNGEDGLPLYWEKTLFRLERGEQNSLTALLNAACDDTLIFTSLASKAQCYKQAKSCS